MKNSNHKVALTIQASPEATWDVIGAVNGVNNWLAPITACRVEGNKRFCSTEEGEFSEDILKVDHENKVLKYSIPVQHMIPVQNIIGEMRVLATDEGTATVEWTWNFEVEATKEAEAKETLTMVGSMGINGIEAYINN